MAPVYPPQPEKWQYVLELRRGGLSRAQIAEATGISVHTLSERVTLGGKMLKRGLSTEEAGFRAEWDAGKPAAMAAAAKCFADGAQKDPHVARQFLNWHVNLGVQKHEHSGELTFHKADEEWADRKIEELQRALDHERSADDPLH